MDYNKDSNKNTDTAITIEPKLNNIIKEINDITTWKLKYAHKLLNELYNIKL